MVESNSTFYNWGMTLLIISLVAVLASAFIQDMSVNYQQFTTVNQSPSFYVSDIGGLSVMSEMGNITRDAQAVLETENTRKNVSFLGLTINPPSALVDLSDFGIILFKSVGPAFRIVLKIFSIPATLLPKLWNAFPFIDDNLGVKVFIMAAISLALIFMVIRVVTKKQEI